MNNYEEYDVFYENEELISMIEDLKNIDQSFNVHRDNICTFQGECMEFGVTYATFLNKFVDMSNKELMINNIDISGDDYEEDCDIDFIDGEDIDFFMEDNLMIDINFKIDGHPANIEVEFGYDWFSEAFVYKFNEILGDLNKEKYLWLSNCGEECNIIYASQDDIDKINKEMAKSPKFSLYNPFVIEGEMEY